jgi:hypothetical protein
MIRGKMGGKSNSTRRAVRGAVAMALATLASACGSTSTGPATDMSGEWEFSYDTMTAGLCPSAPPGHVAGCQAAGMLDWTQTGPGLAGAATVAGSCQACGFATDFHPIPQPVIGSLEQSHLEFVFRGCSFTGQAIDGPSEYTGEASCPVDGSVTTGRWRLARAPTP